MQCKNCGSNIPEGYLYCPKCGEEIIIVSDFEIKLEENIDMSSIAGTIELPDVSAHLDESSVRKVKDVNNTKKAPKTSKINIKVVLLIVVAAVILLTALFFGIRAIINYNSFEYNYNKGQEEYKNHEYEAAVKSLKHAIGLEDNLDASILLAEVYFSVNNYDAAIACLYNQYEQHPDNYVLLEKIIECYKAQGDSKGIHELIVNSNDSNLALKYSEYVSLAPIFSLEAGNYIEPDPIKLSSVGEGVIYYTTDGSEPTTDSLQYIGPIPLDFGENKISAMFINEKGIKSEIVTNVYVVEMDIPADPQLLVASGSFSQPKLIGVSFEEGTSVYYTTDGSEPDVNNNQYVKPFLMPVGKSTFSFVAVNEAGNRSNIVRGNYNLIFKGAIDVSVAEYAISYQLTSKGENVLLNTYKTDYGYSDGVHSYYIIDEYTGNQTTGRQFAVDINSGELFNFSYADGNYSTSPL